MTQSSLRYDFQIPDPDRPIPEDQRGAVGPSGVLFPFHPEPIRPESVIGRRVDGLSHHVGTYGMGGPGFFGLRLGDDWLVVAIWGAGNWIHADRLPVQDDFHEDHGRPRPWIDDTGDRLSPALTGSRIAAFAVGPHSLGIGFDWGPTLCIDASPDDRPIFEGSKEPRAFLDGDDLRRAVFLAPTDELWV